MTYQATDIFIERMVRKFSLTGICFPNNPEAAQWAVARWQKAVRTQEEVLGDPERKPVLWVLDCRSPSENSISRDSDIVERLQGLEPDILRRGCVMFLNWDLVGSPQGDYPTKDEVEGVLPPGRRTYTLNNGTVLMSEPTERPPQVSSKPPKVKISARYVAEEEIRNDDEPYAAYLQAMEAVVDFPKISSFCDVGCATGNLIKLVKQKHKHIEVRGLEFFPYHKEAADPLIQDCIQIHDLRDPLFDRNTSFDLVNCTEVGEHIDPGYQAQFMENLKILCGYKAVVQGNQRPLLFLSWSDSGGEHDREHDPRLQHLHPLSGQQVEEMMRSHSFVKHEVATKRFVEVSLGLEKFSPWWRKSFGVWVPSWVKVGGY